MKRGKWVAAAALTVLVAGGLVGYPRAVASSGADMKPTGAMRRTLWRMTGTKTGQLQLQVVDAVTNQGIPGAGCVVAETKDRVETNAKGVAPVLQEPVFRNPRLEELLAELHGQLNVICYKKGYRDSIYVGVRMHEGATTNTAVWMYPIGYGDTRVEPTSYQMDLHRLWMIQLADKYRLHDEGEGPERPDLSRPKQGPAPQLPQGGGTQTPPFKGPPGAPSPATPPAPAAR
jgi:hypothetical protein